MNPNDQAPVEFNFEEFVEYTRLCDLFWIGGPDNVSTTAEQMKFGELCEKYQGMDTRRIMIDAFTALQEELEGRKEAYSKLDDVNIKLNEQIAKLKEAYGVLREALKDAQSIERDRIFEDLRCPGFDGSMKIETRYDEAIAKAEEVLK